MICEVDGNRIANDINKYLIAMWKELIYNNFKPKKYDKIFYNLVKNNKDEYEDYLVGWLGFNCSYSGKYFGGFAGETLTKYGTIRDYQQEAINNINKQIEKLKGVNFHNKNYNKLEIPSNSIIYCDPPYENTTKYQNSFNHELFWDWCRKITKEGHKVYISEYNAPNDFICIWQKEVKSSLSANGKSGGSKNSIEKLFKYDNNK